MHASTGLLYLRARYYDPSAGRFLSRDTWAYDFQNPVELNGYGYVAGNPVKYKDRSGLAIWVNPVVIGGDGGDLFPSPAYHVYIEFEVAGGKGIAFDSIAHVVWT
jgi:RHS repeat-associated protein